MAQLTEAERLQIWRGFMRVLSRSGDECGFVKSDLKAAVDALDVFLENNAAAINSALPASFRTAATVDQKAFLLAAVVLRRYNVEALKKLVGEVD